MESYVLSTTGEGMVEAVSKCKKLLQCGLRYCPKGRDILSHEQ